MMNEQEALRKFKTRVVKARSAYACCRKGFLRSSQYALEIMDFIREQFNKPHHQPASVLLPRIEPVIRVTGIPKPSTGQLVFGVVDLETGQQIATGDGPFNEAELQAQANVVNMITETQRRSTQDCIRCIDRALLGNSKRRRNVTLKRKRPGVANVYLNLRVPHR